MFILESDQGGESILHLFEVKKLCGDGWKFSL